jgi:serine/threonine protein kinase
MLQEMRDGGDLVLGHRLGVGGAATIFAARWRGREVSAKVAHLTDDDRAGDLAVEAGVLSRVSHAALLEVLACGKLADGRPYLVLPRLRGEDLAARLRRGPLSVAGALEVIAAVGGALTALHAAGVVHRDLKPENVFLDDSGVFLLDLGLARDIAAGTSSWRIRGTYDVMAPERLYGEPAGVPSEVYELGALAWAALTGALPWPAGAAPSARRGIPPLAIEGDVGAALDAVLRSALSTVPERRPASVGELVTALHDAARDPHPIVAARRTAELGASGAARPAVTAMPAPGSVIAESYRLLGILGSGGAGTVFAAEHLRLPRRLAIKVLRPDGGGRDARARFQREAEIIASLSHPHIVEVFDYDVDECGAPFMVMELLEGETLRDRLGRGRLATADVVELVRQVASAVSAAHARDVVHRDLKPSNLFLRRTTSGAVDVKVLDFGISKVLGNPLDDTTSGLAVGSPGYAAPEQSRGDGSAIGPATDVFALAAIAYEALSGRRAFEAPTREAVLQRILGDDPDPLRGHGLSRAIDRVVRGGLARRPDRRPPSVQAFAVALAIAATERAAPRRRLRRMALGASLISTFAAAFLIARPGGGDGAAPGAAAIASAARTATLQDAVRIAHRSMSSPAVGGDLLDAPDTPGSGRDVLAAPGPAIAPRPLAASGETRAPVAPEAAVAGPGSDGAASSAPGTSRTVRMRVHPSTTRVIIDGVPVTGERVALPPGPHDLRATAPGYQPLGRVINAATLGDALDVRLEVRSLGSTRRTGEKPPRQPESSRQAQSARAAGARTVQPPKQPELPSLRSLLEQ